MDKKDIMVRIDALFQEVGYGTSEAYKHGFNQGIKESANKVIDSCASELHKGLKKLKADDMLHKWLDNELDKVRKQYDN